MSDQSDPMPDDWPCWPEGVERVLIFRMPEGDVPPAGDCFVCGKPMPDASAGEMAWGVPDRGLAHGDCYEPEVEDDA